MTGGSSEPINRFRHANRDHSLTTREVEIAQLVARGFTNRQIAAQLVIATGTADRHIANILTKLSFHSRSEIAAWVTAQQSQSVAVLSDTARRLAQDCQVRFLCR